MESPVETRAMSRHEQVCTLGEMIASAGRVIRNGGRLDVVFPAARMLEMMDAMRSARMEPKRLRLVCGHAMDAPKLVLIEAVKNARPMLHVEPVLILYEMDGAQTQELRRIYGQAAITDETDAAPPGARTARAGSIKATETDSTDDP